MNDSHVFVFKCTDNVFTTQLTERRGSLCGGAVVWWLARRTFGRKIGRSMLRNFGVRYRRHIAGLRRRLVILTQTKIMACSFPLAYLGFICSFSRGKVPDNLRLYDLYHSTKMAIKPVYYTAVFASG